MSQETPTQSSHPSYAPHVDLRRDGAAALEWAARYLETLESRPVLPQVEPGQVRAALPASPPEHPETFEALLRDMDRVIVPGTTQWQHPRYFAYIANSATDPGILAELLSATLNTVAFIWRTSPATTELEFLMLDWAAQLLGLPQSWHGHIESSGSVSTIAALAAARHATGRRVVVCSEHAHSSVDRAARLLDMGLRKIPVDATFRMRPEALDLTDAAAVVATVGTTSTTSADPVAPIADACERTGTWLHVDAAYAGSAWVCPELRGTAAGVERADSLVVNAHKWLATPMDCSLVWTRKPEALRAAFSLTPEYLRTPDVADSLSDYGPDLGRRFRALKLWAVFRCHGRSGLQAMIREHIRIAALFEQWVRETPGWTVCAPRPFSVVCFRKDASDEENEALLHRVNATGEMFLSHTKLDGRYVLRLAIGNARTREEDVRRAWDVLRRQGERSI
jgi:aromatic-L-amino-acid decarboxylase